MKKIKTIIIKIIIKIKIKTIIIKIKTIIIKIKTIIKRKQLNF